MSSRLADLESATVVPSTPADGTTADPTLLKDATALPTKEKSNHFNASLDQALHLLEQQQGQHQFFNDASMEKSPTPINWSLTGESTDQLPPLSLSKDTDAYSVSDDLILDNGAGVVPDSPRTCVSRASMGATLDSEDPQVVCQVRARIPYPGGHFYLHLYHTAEDNKEHLAIVFGDDIRSASLERIQGTCETEMQRRIRGASTGERQKLIMREISQRNQAQPRHEVSQEDHGHGMVVEDSADRFYSRRISLIDAPLVRIHSECFTGETVSSVRCDCGYQLAEAMRLIQREGRGVIVYLRQEGRGIGLLEKLKAYNLQDMGHDTVDANLLLNHPADARTYGSARAILVDLGVSKMRLLTNNADKIRQICGAGAGSSSRLEVVCHVPMFPRWWLETGEEGAQAETGGSEDLSSYARHLGLKRNVMSEADKYLRTKAERMGHMLSMSESSACLPGIINH